jgi:transcriptional regulator with XRE-family HTH domain
MSAETPQARTLHRALKNYGGAAELAKALKVTVAELNPWLTGREGPSVKIYMATLKLIADARPKTR